MAYVFNVSHMSKDFLMTRLENCMCLSVRTLDL